MAIINTNTSNLTTQQKQTRAKARISGGINVLYKQMLRIYTAAMDDVWSNEDGLTPQQVFDGYGTDAGELVRLAGLLKTTVNTATPNTITADSPKTLTVNNDGTVTVGA